MPILLNNMKIISNRGKKMKNKKILIVVNLVLLTLVIGIIFLIGTAMLQKEIVAQPLIESTTPETKAPFPQENIAPPDTDIKSEINKALLPESVTSPIDEAKQSSTLKGKIICIDAGHQAKANNEQEPVAPGSKQTKAKVSSGTRGAVTGKYEYELNLEVALKLRQALLNKEAVVYMIREEHDVNISNAERAELANSVNADISIRIHADGSNNSSTNGFSILIPGADYVNKELVIKSELIAESLENSLLKNIPNKSRGIVTRNDLTGFNWCQTPAVLIEMGFMSNPEEDQRMCTETFQDHFSEGIVKGLEEYFTNHK
jgi:N-acetylmuramoyl-L-alanine amidase